MCYDTTTGVEGKVVIARACFAVVLVHSRSSYALLNERA